MVLYRHEKELYCRVKGPFQIDGAKCDGGGPVTPHSRVEGEGFAFNLEAIEA